MEASTVVGFGLLLLGAVCGGCFGLPSKFVKKEVPWEALWGPFFFFVTILQPLIVFPLIAQGLFATCSQAAADPKVGAAAVVMPVLFGFLWGLGSMTLGLSFGFIGLSLAYAINYGAQIAWGGMGPFVIHHPEQLFTKHGYLIMAGVVVCILGVIVCGRAGVLKSKSQASGDAAGAQGTSITKGMILAFVSGLLCACYSIAFSYGTTVMDVSKAQGNAGWRAAFAVSALILWGGALSACGYCVYKLCANKTWGALTAAGAGKVLLIALVMSLLHNAAILFFGVGASYLGALGVEIGYAAFMSFAIIVGNINGFLTGEWKGADSRSKSLIVAGIAVLVAGVSTLAWAKIEQQNWDAAQKPTVAVAAVAPQR